MIAPILVWFTRILAAKLLLAFGVGAVTFYGYVEVMDTLEASVVDMWGGLPADLLAYLSIAGIADGLGIILTAVSIRSAIIFAPKLGLLYSAVTS